MSDNMFQAGDERQLRRDISDVANEIRKALSTLTRYDAPVDSINKAIVILAKAHEKLTGTDWRTATISD